MSRQQGLVENVETFQARSFASADAAISDTVVFVSDASQFLTGSGTCTVEIAGDEYEASPAIDLETYNDYLTLVPPLATAVSELDPVTLVPAAETKWAWVSLSEDEEDLLRCRVPLALKGYSSLADGSRTGDGREAVWIETEPEPALVDPPNQTTLFDGAEIDPATTIPPAALTDGLPPSGSPTPTLDQFSIGGIAWSVTPVANADPVRFKVYADTVDPPAQDAAHLVQDTASHKGSFSKINDVRLLPDDPDVPPDPIYVAVVEYDADGEATMGATSDPMLPRRADNADISALYAYLGSIEANQIAAGSVLTQLLNVGDYLEIDGDASSITIFADVEHTQPLVQLRPDGSIFRGQVIADDVSVLNGLVLQGLLSHIAQNAGVTIDLGVGNPGSAPTLTVQPSQQTWPAVPSGYNARGIAWDGTKWLRLIRSSTGTVTKVETINTSGVRTGTVTLDNMATSLNASGIVKIGSSWYVMARVESFDETDAWRIYKYDTDGTRLATSGANYVTRGGSRPAIGTDGTNILVVNGYDETSVDVVTTGFVGTASYTVDEDLVDFGSHSFMYVGRGNFDLGANRFVIASASDAWVFSLSGTDLIVDTAKSFAVADNVYYGGFGWDGSNFFSSRTFLNKYNGYYPAASENAYIAHRDNNGADHTKVSPIASVALKKRYYIQAAIAPAPSGAATPSVWMKLATSSPAATALLARSETITSRNVLLDPSVAGGSALTTDTNTFGAGTPGWIKSQSGGFEVYGDGTVVVDTYPVTGAWTPYTPAWTGATTNPTAANHTITGKYKRIGKTVHFEIEITAGSSGYGSGAYSVSLPFAAAANTRVVHNGSLRTNITIPLFAERSSTTTLLLRVLPTTAGGGFTSMAQGTPVTLVAGNTIVISGTYEAA